MNLYICEKPSQGRDLARVLKCTSRHEGSLSNGTDTVTWCLGHLLELLEPHEYDPKYRRWCIEDLPIIPERYNYKVKSASAKQYKVVADLIKKADCVYIATDFDREGEAIARTLLDRVHYRGTVKRVCLSALDDISIRRALGSIREGSETVALYYSAQARLRADWVVGMNLSRLFTLLGRKSGFNDSIPVGRVLTPTVSLVVERDLQIRNFVPVPYYELKITAVTEKGKFPAYWNVPENIADDAGRCLKREEAVRVASEVNNAGGTITEAEKKQVKEGAPLPFDLTSLQQYAAKKWGYTAQQTLDAAQALYETHKATTYPRTDSRYLPLSQFADVPHVLDTMQKADPALIPLIAKADPNHRGRAFKSEIDSAHHAIIPTMKVPNLAVMNPCERNIYNAVRAYYLMQFFPDAEFMKSVIGVSVGGHRFTAKGRILMKQGWREVPISLGLLGSDSSDEDQNEESQEDQTRLPNVQANDPCMATEPAVTDKKTAPPAHFTEATLLAAMENIGKYVQEEKFKKILRETAGIGTPATRAGIIENAIRHNYLQRQKKSILATDKSFAVIEKLPAGIKSAGLTAAWEQELDKIAHSSETTENFMLNIEKWIRSMISNYLARNDFVIQNVSGSGAMNASGTSNAGKSNTRYAKNSTKSVNHRQKSTAKLKKNNDKSICYPKEIKQSADADTTVAGNAPICPDCGQPMVLRTNRAKGSRFWGCSAYPKCRGTLPIDDR